MPRKGSPPPSPPATFSAAMMEENIADAEEIIAGWDPRGSSSAGRATSLFRDGRGDAPQFLRAVADLRRAMHFFVKDARASSSALLVRAQALMDSAMRRLQTEFYRILSSAHDPETSIASSRSSSSFLSDLEGVEMRSPARAVGGRVGRLSALPLDDLRSIAECMVLSGYGKECVKIYKLVRRSAVEEDLYRLGFDKTWLTQVQKLDWDALDTRVQSWIRACKAAVSTLFSGERLLCQQVFPASASTCESCFADISAEPAIQLFTFPKLVATRKQISPDKIFGILDMYSCVSELWPELESIFSYPSVIAVRSQAASSLLKLGEQVRSLLIEFEASIQRDISKVAVPGGGLHPLNRYVMNYVSLLSDYGGALEEILAGNPLPTGTPLPENGFASASISPSSGDEENPQLQPTSPVSAWVAWLILVLLCKLNSKAELYREAALGYLFLANNLRYVVNKVSGSGLLELLGSGWAARHAGRASGFASSYERLSWNKVLAAIPRDGAATSPMDAQAATESMRRFNEIFEKVHRGQAGWVVADEEMREGLKLSVLRKLLPAYTTFYGRCRSVLRGEGNSGSVVRFAPEDLSNCLLDLFHGNSGERSSVSSDAGSPESGSSRPRRSEN